MANLNNVSLKDFRNFLQHQHCKHIRTTGGHEIWARSDLLRSITIQSHIDPVPRFIVQQILRALNVNKERFLEIMDEI